MFAPYLVKSDGTVNAEVTSATPIEFDPTTGAPTDVRILIFPLYLQLGVFLDYWTGEHAPSLSATLRSVLERSGGDLDAALLKALPKAHRGLFPQLALSAPGSSGGGKNNWPPTLFVHGTADTGIPGAESRHLYHLLSERRKRPPTRIQDKLIEVEGGDHGFDIGPEAQEKYAGVFDEIVEWVKAVVGCADDGKRGCK